MIRTAKSFSRFRRGWLAALAVLVLVPFTDSRSQHVSTNVNHELRQQALARAIELLQSAKPEPPAHQIEIFDLKHFERDQLACTLYSRSFIRIGETDWIIFLLHSAHDDPEIGDLVLAIDQDGNMYSCVTHVCGGSAAIESDSLVYPTSSREFFALFHSAYDRDKNPWTPLDIQPAQGASDP